MERRRYNSGTALARPFPGEEVVITGIAGCFPESRNVYELADNLYNKIDMVTADDRRGPRTNAEIPNRLGKIPSINKFDAGYFGVCYEEAEQMDSKLRMMLEKTFEAIVDSGYAACEMANARVGVFVPYAESDAEDQALLMPSNSPNFAVTGCCGSMLAQRISQHFRFVGPSYTLDAACSSTLHALEHAYRALRENRCEHAIVAGGQLCLNDMTTLNFTRMDVLSADGACKVFDERANGYVRSEIVAAIHVQKSRNARRIYAQVLHVKTNFDGYKETGIGAPSSEWQMELYRDIYRDCMINPSSVDFVEAHGTGTRVGDVQEMLAVDSTFCKERKQPLPIGSVKSLVGHAESASFFSSLVKVLISMENEQILPNIHFVTPRLAIEGLEKGRMVVPVEVMPWPDNGSGLVAINNIGYGGSNAHILLKRFSKRKSTGDSLPRLVCVSGRTEQAVGDVLHDIGSRKLDAEYCELVQHAFRDDHPHRGFIIHSKLGVIASATGVPQRREYCVFFSDASDEIVEIGRKLYEITSFANAVKRMDASLEKLVTGDNARVSLAIQLSLVDMLKEVNLPVSFEMGKGLANGKLISNRYKITENFKDSRDHIVISLGSEGMAQDGFSQINISVDDPIISLLKLLGGAYLMGYPVRLDPLYPPVTWPVSRGTPMISHLIKWNHDTDWFTLLQNQKPIVNKVSIVSKSKVWSCLPGHVIDGLPVNPAAGYLYMIWEKFSKMVKVPLACTPVFFENVKFLNDALMFPAPSEFYLSISKITQKFELHDLRGVRVAGSIRMGANGHEGLSCHFDVDKEHLSSEDIYKELRVRGYNYAGSFCELEKSNLSCEVTQIKWQSNWVTFIDGLLQARLLHEDTRELRLPAAIDYLTIDASKFVNRPNQLVRLSRTDSIVSSECVEIRGVSTVSLPRRNAPDPVTEIYTFVPLQTELSTDVAVRIFVQIFLENTRTFNVKIVEVGEGNLAPAFQRALNDHLFVTSSICKSRNLGNHSNCGIVVLSEPSTHPHLLRDALRTDGVVITRNKASLPGFAIVSMIKTGSETLVLLKQEHVNPPPAKIITVSNKLEWLAEVQEVVKNGEEAVLLAQNEPLSGILGLINCLRREPGGAHLRCIFIMDHGVRFNLGDKFFADQLQLRLAINVLRNGVWGTYRHLLLEPGEKVVRQHIFGELPKDQASFQWVEGPLTAQDPVEPGIVMVQVHCAAVNFDARGPSTSDRLSQRKDLGTEFSGRDSKGRRVMGLVPSGALSTLVSADALLLWELPDEWSFEDAASVPLAYTMALYGVVHLAKVSRGKRILIHSGASEIGLAAIHLARYYKCEIFTTADSKREIQLIKATFPEIPDSHIAGARDGSFETMAFKHTIGRGVDIIIDPFPDHNTSPHCLTRKGRFITLGKRDLPDGTPMLLPCKGQTFGAFSNFNGMKVLLHTLVSNALAKGMIKPLNSLSCAPGDVQDVNRAVVKMRQAQLAGFPRFWCDSHMTYVIVGGLGGFGLELVDWLALKGGRKFVLVSRNGVVRGYAAFRIKLWRSYGAVVRVATDNATCREGCATLLRNAAALGPVAGIFNVASVVTDRSFEDQNEERFITAFSPKAHVTRNLDVLSRQLCPSLQHFVVFSSLVCGRGNIGQAAYGMANSIAERICETRKRDGLPGLAIQWGPIGEVGTEVGKQDRGEQVLGALQQDLTSCLSCLDEFLVQAAPIVSSMVISKKFKGTDAPVNVLTMIRDILGISNLKTVSEHATLSELGMDSITFVQVKQVLEREMELYLTAQEVRQFTFAQIKGLVLDICNS